MTNLKNLLMAISVTLSASGAGAQSSGDGPSIQPVPGAPTQLGRFLGNVFDGSAATLRARNQHDNEGNLTRNQGQYIVDLKMQFNLTTDGKLKLKGRVLSGPRFDSDTANLGIGNNTEFQNNLNLRQLYFEYAPAKNLYFQAGAIPSLPTQVPRSPLAISTNGWVDGARGAYMPATKWMNAVAVTVGRVDSFTDLNALHRLGHEELSPNFLQVHVRGDLSKIVKYTAEGTALTEKEYLRGMLEIATRDVIAFVDSVVIENMIGTGDSLQKGFAASLKKAVGAYTLTGAYSYKAKEVAPNGHFLLDDNYNRGRQLSLIAEHPAGKRGLLQARVFKNVDKGIPFWANNGMRAEVNYRFTWKK